MEAAFSARSCLLAWRWAAVDEAAFHFATDIERALREEHREVIASAQARITEVEGTCQSLEITALRASARAEAADQAVQRLLAQHRLEEWEALDRAVADAPSCQDASQAKGAGVETRRERVASPAASPPVRLRSQPRSL